MRLLDTHTGHFIEVSDISNIKYAILSHTWDTGGEQTYEEVRNIQIDYPIQRVSSRAKQPSIAWASRAYSRIRRRCCRRSSDRDNEVAVSEDWPSDLWGDHRLAEKIKKSCEVARNHGYRLLWIDSCCINKSSSSELSEAINSMYAWYGHATICYAFLADVPYMFDYSEGSPFRDSRWFKRGWTLQELIAPKHVVFLSKDWRPLGSKGTMAAVVEEITGIDRQVLTHKTSFDTVSVAQRMSWAAKRETTRTEDRAYSLLGIFDLNMPTLYGEGERAFQRLQEEILRRIPDQSLFAWGHVCTWQDPLPVSPTGIHDLPRGFGVDLPQNGSLSKHVTSFFASSPSDFAMSGTVGSMAEDDYLRCVGESDVPHLDYTTTPYGIRSQFLVLPLQAYFPDDEIRAELQRDIDDLSELYLAILRCHTSQLNIGRPNHCLARLCSIVLSPSKGEVVRGREMRLRRRDPYKSTRFEYEIRTFAVLPLTMTKLKDCLHHLRIRSAYMPHPDRTVVSRAPTSFRPYRTFDDPGDLKLSPYTTLVLHAWGYDVEFREPTSGALAFTYSLILRRRQYVLQLNISDFRHLVSLVGGRYVNVAAAWLFTEEEAQHHRLPLSTYQGPVPHGAARYIDDAGFRPIVLRKPNNGLAIVIRLGIEREETSDYSSSYFVHVEVEESDTAHYSSGGSTVDVMPELEEARRLPERYLRLYQRPDT
ncbi:heterokaryon incompatibility protein-domain-containing protein [Dichomitus squalens]|uniref:Heterokaryon incompatibility protein-domain-containing protein n=1 Tax=Dichomitus squalens TaxID=114155 RepID=A0A4Q9MDG8_9APHY|nr:heterokaryon incompatibility protein-domain-containing protein [Dichomitus squalens]